MNRLKELRISRQITQEEIGQILGVKKAAISKYENEKVNLPHSVVMKLSEFFGVSSDYLLGRDEVVPMFKKIIPTKNAEKLINNAAMVPLLGRVHAGLPIMADENIAEYIPISFNTVSDIDDCFFMQVEGDCMTGDHIVEGALVLVQKCSSPPNNSIAVVRLEDEVLLRRVQFFGSSIVLIPSNPAYTPLVVTDGNVEIIGKVIEVRISY